MPIPRGCAVNEQRTARALLAALPGRVPLRAGYRSGTAGGPSPSSSPPLGGATMVMWMWTVSAWITTRPSPTSRVAVAVSGSTAAASGWRLSAAASSGM